ncbi:hypothetical protein F4803DRAFT_576793 [Xylaria telfairii]|nr:hypothetical protein F4803DRAFT_576793 [Xylaria telfairii]
MYSIRGSQENPAWHDIIFNAVFNVLTIGVVGLRLWSRRLTRAGFGWDDCFILIATLLVNGMLEAEGFLIYLGFGLPAHKIAPDNIKKITELDRTFRFLFLLCICAVKLSALFFYLRVFGTRTLHSNRVPHLSSSDNDNPGTNTGLQLSLHRFCRFTQRPSLRFTYIFLIYVVIAWSVANIIQELVVCPPHNPMCAYQRNTDLGICVFNAGGDLLILLLPLWPIWRLQMNKGAKMGLTLVFLLGTVTIVVAFLRFEAIVNTDYGGDYSGTAMKSADYAILEPNFAILCISLPMLQQLLCKVVSHFNEKSRGRSGDRFSNWWARSPLMNTFARWRTEGLSRIFATSEGASSSSRNNSSGTNPQGSLPQVDIQPSAIQQVLKPSSDDRRSGTGTQGRDGDESRAPRTKSLWRTNSHGSSLHELMDFARDPVSASTVGSGSNSLRSKDEPPSPPTGASITIFS